MTKIIAILGVFGLSFSSIFVRFSNCDSIVLAFYRMLFACLLLTPVIWRNNKEEYSRLSLKNLGLCLFSGICFGLHLRMAFLAFEKTTIAAATVLVNTEVFFVAFGALIVMGEKVKKGQWLGILIAFAGSVVIAGGDAGGGSSSMLAGDLFAVAGAILSSIYTLIGKSCRKYLSTTAYTGLVYLGAAMVLAFSMGVGGVSFTGYDPYNYLLALGLTLICTFLGHSIFSWCLKYETAAYVSLVKLLEPVFATVMAVLLFREIPGFHTLAGGLVVIGGIICYHLLGNKDQKSEAFKPE